MKSTVLTSSENIAALKEARAKREALKAAKVINAQIRQEKALANAKKKEEKAQAVAKKKAEKAEKAQAAAKKKEEKAQAIAKKKEEKALANAKKKEEKSRGKKHKNVKSVKRKRLSISSSGSDDQDICIICGKGLPIKMTCQNSIKCIICKESAHFDCADHRHLDFICNGCEPDDEEFSDSE